MANFLSGFLNNVGQGLTNPKGNVGDFAHAARLYNTNAFKYSPKVKFLYHVVFNINPDAIKSSRFDAQRYGTAINMLVRAVDLPKFKISVDPVNQYNRKKQVQTKLEYDPITVTFHDDNFGVTTALWSMYYGYYFADSKTPNAYQRNTYKAPALNVFRYGLDNNSSVPFFSSITVYQMARHYYQAYMLMNPIISSWQHDSLDNSESETVKSTMSLQYESVIYSQGKVSPTAMAGFGTEFYDKQPSPLGILGGGTVSIFGTGGVVDGITGILGDFASGSAFTPAGFLGTLIKGSNLINNAKKLSTDGIRQEGYNVLTNAIGTATGIDVSGVANIAFPKNSATTQTQTTTALGPTSVRRADSDGQRLLSQLSSNPATNESAARIYYAAAGIVSNGQRLTGADASNAFNNLPATTKANSVATYNTLLSRNLPAAVNSASKALA